MATMDLEYDENRGNPPAKECLISLARSEDLYQATAVAWPWGDPADGDADYAVLPIAFVETLFRKAPVPDPTSLQAVPFISSCLHLHDYLEPMLQLMVAEDLLAEDDGGGGVYVFRDRTELQGYADAIIEGAARLQFAVDDSAFDATDAGPLPGIPLGWLRGYSLGTLTATSGDLSVYVDLAWALGPRAVNARRLDAGGQLLSS